MKEVTPTDFVYLERLNRHGKPDGNYLYTVNNGKHKYFDWGLTRTPFMFANENTERAQQVWQTCLNAQHSNYRWKHVNINDAFVMTHSTKNFNEFWKNYHAYYGGKYLMILSKDENTISYVVIGNKMHDNLK
jgi:hypothetical protein